MSGPPEYDPLNTAIPLCIDCGERFQLPDESYCSGCLIHAEDEGDRACDACGSTLDWTGGCGCDLPPADDLYWVKRRV